MRDLWLSDCPNDLTSDSKEACNENHSGDLASERLALWQAFAQPVPEAVAQRAHHLKWLTEQLLRLHRLQRLWAYPGSQVLAALTFYLESTQFARMHQLAGNVYQQLLCEGYKRRSTSSRNTLAELDQPGISRDYIEQNPTKNYFEVLVIACKTDFEAFREHLSSCQTDRDEHVYDMVLAEQPHFAFELLKHNTLIQACIYLDADIREEEPHNTTQEQGLACAAQLRNELAHLRPELSHYYVAEGALKDQAFTDLQAFQEVFWSPQSFQLLHQAVLSSLRKRFSTPFFHALKNYSQKPKEVFHALPLSQGKSVASSPWTQDFYQFFGENLFRSETSSTQGGLDSLLDPRGAIQQAQDRAAEAFGAQHAYFVTNGTSTCNKIVMQAVLRPGDIALIAADCHKSVPYSVMSADAYALFLPTYPLPSYDLYGAVPLETIKATLLRLKKLGQLNRVRQITLTNSTFDGLTYNVEQFMLEILAIKPDMVFHWDEAWHGFSYFHWLYQGRTAMGVANRLKQRFQSAQYREFYQNWRNNLGEQLNKVLVEGCEDLISTGLQAQPLYPDPDQAVLRVYATQSTHKTLTAFRQGSMILVHDEQFRPEHFLECYRMHTSTSPSYPILASLDVGRRQMELEGYHLIHRLLNLALQFRRQLRNETKLNRYFSVLDDEQLVPAKERVNHQANHQANDQSLSTDEMDLNQLQLNWQKSHFAVDPTRITLDISKTGMDGACFRHLLISRYAIQINKTSSHTVLFIFNIGTDHKAMDYLLRVLREIADRLHSERAHPLPPPKAEPVMPQSRRFHPLYNPIDAASGVIGDMRRAYYAGVDPEATEWLSLQAACSRACDNASAISATFVTPYPPGFPVLVPGQIITRDIAQYLLNSKIKEIHGLDPRLGLKVLKERAVNRVWHECEEKPAERAGTARANILNIDYLSA